MLRGQVSGLPAPRGPVQQPSLEKGGLVYSLDGVGVLPAGCGQGIQSHRATGERVYDASQPLVVKLVQTQGSPLPAGQGFPGMLPGYSTIGHNLRGDHFKPIVSS